MSKATSTEIATAKLERANARLTAAVANCKGSRNARLTRLDAARVEAAKAMEIGRIELDRISEVIVDFKDDYRATHQFVELPDSTSEERASHRERVAQAIEIAPTRLRHLEQFETVKVPRAALRATITDALQARATLAPVDPAAKPFDLSVEQPLVSAANEERLAATLREAQGKAHKYIVTTADLPLLIGDPKIGGTRTETTNEAPAENKYHQSVPSTYVHLTKVDGTWRLSRAYRGRLYDSGRVV